MVWVVLPECGQLEWELVAEAERCGAGVFALVANELCAHVSWVILLILPSLSGFGGFPDRT